MSNLAAPKGGKFSIEESLNYSLPTLGRKNAHFSSFTDSKASKPFEVRYENGGKLKPLVSPVMNTELIFSPHRSSVNKKLPNLVPGKKNITIISKSKSAQVFPPAVPESVTPGPEDSKPTINIKPKPNQNPEKSLDPTLNVTFKEYYYMTMPGFSDGRVKTNQDAFYINISIKNSNQCSLYAVFDGHGPLGHKVSEFLKKNLTGNPI